MGMRRERAAIAWLCECGRHGIVDSVRTSVRELEEHLAGTGHASGEYFYGCPGQRTTVAVSRVGPGQLTHRVV